jgi:hypothetical protein
MQTRDTNKSASDESNARGCQQTKSQQIVSRRDIDFLLLESTRYADYLKAPTQRRFWLASCRNGRKARTTVPPADAKFLDEMRKMLDLRNRWALLAGLPVTEQIAIRHGSEPSGQPNRTAAN